jgi:3-hydroxybutyryl-CoA dehydrogenase
MNLVEIIPGSRTSKQVLDFSVDIVTQIGKTSVICRDFPGFIINRLLLLFINESMRMVEEKAAKISDIDTAAREGLNHPMGPLELADLIGLDILLDLLRILNKDLGERYKPAGILKKMVNPTFEIIT